MSNFDNNILIETSISDALDRLSILDVKLKKITDNDKLEKIKYEKKLLSNKLDNHIDKVNFYYNTLVTINLKIWELLDEAKNNDNIPMKQLQLFKDQEDYNERRFRVKSKIDYILNSTIKEQKGYKHKKAMVLGHLGMGDQFYIIGMVRYLSTMYDEVLVICKNNTENNVRQIYSDDQSIKIMGVPSDRVISPAYGASISQFNKIFDNYTKYLLGFHQHGLRAQYGIGKQIYDLPFSFYDDVQIDYQVFWDYFHVNKPDNSIILYNSIKQTKNVNKYIFVHNTSSIGEVFPLDFILDKYNLDKHNTLVINPCKCMYDLSDNYFELASEFLEKPLLDYYDVIENADMVIMSDSSFLCLAQHIEIKTDKCYMYCREGESYNYSYDHIWSNKYKCKSTPNKYKKFTQIN
tara:strand:+ start:13363 stop:14580 length:1218 start_codon:yes stop_codon:yes gene_type:complete